MERRNHSLSESLLSISETGTKVCAAGLTVALGSKLIERVDPKYIKPLKKVGLASAGLGLAAAITTSLASELVRLHAISSSVNLASENPEEFRRRFNSAIDKAKERIQVERKSA